MANSSSNVLSADVKVVPSSPPPSNYYAIEPSSATLETGQQQEFRVIYHAGGLGVVVPDSQISWWVSNTSVGTINSNGVFSALSIGATRVHADLINQVNSSQTPLYANVYVVQSSPPPNGTAYLEITPASAALSIGQTQQFTAIFHASNGNILEVPVQWSAAGGVGVVSASGLFTATSAGSGTVTALYDPVIWTGNETFTASAQVSVTSSPPPPPTGNYITITPSSASLNVGGTQEFDVVYHSGEFVMFVPDENVVWGIDNSAVGSMGTGGIFTANAEGTAILAASYTPQSSTATYKANATVTVSSAPIPPSGGDGGNGGSGGGSSNNGGGMYKTSTTASFSCAGKGGSVKIAYLVSGSPQAIIQIFYLGNGNREQVLFRTVTGTTGFDFSPDRAGSYEVRVSLGADQNSAYFTVPACSPGEAPVTQNVTVRLEPSVELILSKTVDYGNGFSKKFEVYRLNDGKTESYRTDIALSYLSQDNHNNATVADGVPKSVISSQGLITFAKRPSRFDNTKETGFEWDAASIANGERLAWSYSFSRPLTEQMISAFSAPRLIVAKVEPVSGDSGGIGSMLAASIGAIAGLDATVFVLAIALIIGAAYFLIFGRKKDEE